MPPEAPTVETKTPPEQPSPAPAPAPTAKVEAKPDKVEPKPAAKAAPAPATPPKQPKKIDDNEEIPEEEELIQMSPKALKSRLARASKAQLKEAFGTDDIDDIKLRLAKFADHETKAEEERKARLSEQERLKEERDEAKKRASAAEKERDEERSQRVIEREDRRVTAIAEKHLKAKHISKFLPALATDLRKAFKAKDADLLKNEDKWIDKWFKKQIDEEPEFGKDFSAAPPDPQKTSQLTSGINPNKPGPGLPAGSQGAKTARPGQPNSMTDHEIRQAGFTYK